MNNSNISIPPLIFTLIHAAKEYIRLIRYIFLNLRLPPQIKGINSIFLVSIGHFIFTFYTFFPFLKAILVIY